MQHLILSVVAPSLGALLGLGASASAAADAPPPPFYTDKLNLMVYLDSRGGPHVVRDARDWEKRRQHILAGMQLVMGPLPGPERKVPLDVQTVSTEPMGKVTRKHVTYASEQGHRVPAYLLIPNGLQHRTPAVLCLHGSSGPRGRTAGLGPDYPRYTLELAERGYVTIAPDYPTFGDNEVDLDALGYVSGTMKGIWDHMRAVDLLQSLPEVEPERIGVLGVSLGGHNSLFVATFDPRIKAIVSSVGFNSFRDYKGGDVTGWCQRCYMPRIETVYGRDPARLPFDFSEVLGAIAPRPLFIQAPLGDDNFQIASVRRCIEAARPVYGLLGAEQNLVSIHPEGGHGFPPPDAEQAYRFLDNAAFLPRVWGHVVRLALFVLAYNLGNFLRRLVLPPEMARRCLTTMRGKLVRIGARLTRHAQRLVLQMAEVAVTRDSFAQIQPDPAPQASADLRLALLCHHR